MNATARFGSGVGVQWRDLIEMSARERLNELALSLPWLIGSLCFYRKGMIFAGLGCSFLFFLTGLRQSHGAQHYSLGISKGAHEAMLFGLSLLMMGSMHAVQVSHLNHHRHCLEEADQEGASAKMRWWEALLGGPLFVIDLHRAAWRLSGRWHRAWIATEIFAVAWLAVYAASPWAIPTLSCHLSAMLVGECCTGFFAVWTVHHDCVDTAGRTQRGKWLNRISYNMFMHAEHHLYPAVPTAHLQKLAERLDVAGRKGCAQVLTSDGHSGRRAASGC